MNLHDAPMPHDKAEPEPQWFADLCRKMEKATRLEGRLLSLRDSLRAEHERSARLQAQTRKLTGRA